jgi:predicted RNA-binding protein
MSTDIEARSEFIALFNAYEHLHTNALIVLLNEQEHVEIMLKKYTGNKDSIMQAEALFHNNASLNILPFLTNMIDIFTKYNYIYSPGVTDAVNKFIENNKSEFIDAYDGVKKLWSENIDAKVDKLSVAYFDIVCWIENALRFYKDSWTHYAEIIKDQKDLYSQLTLKFSNNKLMNLSNYKYKYSIERAKIIRDYLIGNPKLFMSEISIAMSKKLDKYIEDFAVAVK